MVSTTSTWSGLSKSFLVGHKKWAGSTKNGRDSRGRSSDQRRSGRPAQHDHHATAWDQVPVLHDQASRALISVPITSILRHFPSSVLSQEQRDDHRTSLIKEEKTALATLDRRQVENGAPFCEQEENYEFDQYLKYFECRLLYQPGLWYPFPPSYNEEKQLLSMSMESIASDTADTKPTFMDQNSLKAERPLDILALAKRAVVASREAASLAEKFNIIAAEFDESHIPGLDPKQSIKESLIKEEATVRSKKLLERRSKKRKVSKKPNDVVYGVSRSTIADISRKIDKIIDPNDPLRLFLRDPETRQLLTVKEEKDLFVQIQDLMRLEEVKRRLQVQFDREATLTEWAQAVGMSCQVLQSCLYSGNRSREKMIYANFRLVVHVAKQYQGKGLNIQDLLQEGSMGLMKSLGKFKPKVGCRFPTYAYWWIRQSIRKAIFQNSRTIRLPENVYALLKKIKNARRLCIQEGQLPTNEDLAKRVGITIERLESLLLSSRNPVSIQERPWIDQDVTLQEITADPKVEIPDLSFTKQVMRQHVRNLLGILTPTERHIIQLRYGIHGKERQSLSEIGALYGLSKERIRQLESRALDKLKECLPCQGLGAYVDLLI